MAGEVSFWDWSEELVLLRVAFQSTAARAVQQDSSGFLTDQSCRLEQGAVMRLPSETASGIEPNAHHISPAASFRERLNLRRSEQTACLRHQAELRDEGNSTSSADLFDNPWIEEQAAEPKGRSCIADIAEPCVLKGDSSRGCRECTFLGDPARLDSRGQTFSEESVGWTPDTDGVRREGSPCPSEGSVTKCRSLQLVERGRDDHKLCWEHHLCSVDSQKENQVVQNEQSSTGKGAARATETPANHTASSTLNPTVKPVTNPTLNSAATLAANPVTKPVFEPVATPGYHSDAGGGDSDSNLCSTSQMVSSESTSSESVSLVAAASEEGTRSGGFSMSLPVDLPLKVLGVVARPLLILRHVPAVLTALTLSPRPRQVRKGPRAREGAVSPSMQRQRRLPRPRSRGSKQSHFSRGDPLLDLTCIDWLPETDLSFYPVSQTGSTSSNLESPSGWLCESSQLASTPLTVQDQTGQDHLIGGGNRSVSMTEPNTDCGTLVASADASEGTPPRLPSTPTQAQNETQSQTQAQTQTQTQTQTQSQTPPNTSTMSKPSQSESIEKQAHLKILDSSPTADAPVLELDSFSMGHSPSNLSLEGGFKYQESDGGMEQSPLSSRSTSSSDLDGREAQSDLNSSTNEFDSDLYLPSNRLTFTPPESPAKAAPPRKPISEESRSFSLPPGVTDPVEVERLEQEWAQTLRVRRAENGDQCYMSAAELTSPPWNELVFWHGCDKKGQPVLYCRLGLAVRTLPRVMQERMGCALYSMVELAENHLERPECGWGFQRMTTIVDAEGLGITRMAPVDSLKNGFKLIHRDYPARQGFVYLVNVPPLLGVMIGVFKRVIGCDDRAANERLGVFGRNYRSQLQKDFDPDMLHIEYGGSCTCAVCERKRATNNGADVLYSRLADDEKRLRRPEDWLSIIVS